MGIEFFVNLLIWLVLLGLLYMLILRLRLPAPFPLIIQIVFVLIAIFMVLGLLGVGGFTVPSLIRG